jgi:hypothetical protein
MSKSAFFFIALPLTRFRITAGMWQSLADGLADPKAFRDTLPNFHHIFCARLPRKGPRWIIARQTGAKPLARARGSGIDARRAPSMR